MIWYHDFKGVVEDVVLDLGCMSQMMQHDDQPPLAIVNKVGQLKVPLPMIMNFHQAHMFFVMIIPT
jgi:hypothetical protein